MSVDNIFLNFCMFATLAKSNWESWSWPSTECSLGAVVALGIWSLWCTRREECPHLVGVGVRNAERVTGLRKGDPSVFVWSPVPAGSTIIRRLPELPQGWEKDGAWILFSSSHFPVKISGSSHHPILGRCYELFSGKMCDFYKSHLTLNLFLNFF